LASHPFDPAEQFRATLRHAAERAGLDLDEIPLTFPPSADLGDLATPACFDLARRARRPPRELARAIVEAWTPAGVVQRVEVAGSGYINGYFDRQAVLRHQLTGAAAEADRPAGPKTIVEHTNINPNKAAHIGHLRNAVLGDTLVRCLRRLGRTVEIQNYIDDTGVQVADLVVGFRVLRGEELEQVRERYAEERLRERGERLDVVAWDLYAEVTRFYAEDPARHAHREQTLAAMEQGDNPVAELAAHLARRMVQHHLATMERIGVRYDLLPRESDILALRFWSTAFERLKRSEAIRLVDEGRHAGCWVMQMAGVEEGAGEDEKVIVRSNGTVTYVGKDIAYQLWKLGVLGRDFAYRPFDWSPHEPLYGLWSTTAHAGVDGAPGFGAAHTVYNVIDQRQAYLQRVVAQGLRALGHPDEADRSIHYAYEMVALTPASVQALLPDYPLAPEDAARPYLEMSGRRGLGIRADDLLDALIRRALEEVHRRNPEGDPAETERTAKRIAVGALRYYMLRFSRNRVVAFDLDAALAFEGETGPYLQYSVVRASNILGKVAERFGEGAVDARRLADTASFEALEPPACVEHWSLVLALLRTEAVLRLAVESLELSTVAKHAYELAQAFNSFYHRYPVVQEPDPGRRALRVAVVRAYHDGMIELLRLMGITVPQRM
jgi:arginyl-tRNA synthetase